MKKVHLLCQMDRSHCLFFPGIEALSETAPFFTQQDALAPQLGEMGGIGMSDKIRERHGGRFMEPTGKDK